MAYEIDLLKKMVGTHIATSDDMTSKFVREIIDDETDIEEVGCCLEQMKDAAEEALRFFNKFYESRTEYFKELKVGIKGYCVEWEYIGEGNNGDYTWQDIHDYPHLRANLSYKGKPCIDGSYCTLASTKTPVAELKKASAELVAAVIKAGGVDLDGVKIDRLSEISFPRRVMEKWTWRTYKVT
jgi:hypothetical protein